MEEETLSIPKLADDTITIAAEGIINPDWKITARVVISRTLLVFT
jgi:hypothetical protein